jgi:hypothetical protein
VNPWGIWRLLVTTGIVFLVLGGVFYLFSRAGGRWHLPGDIVIQKGSFTFFFPLATCIVISILLSLIFSYFRKV